MASKRNGLLVSLISLLIATSPNAQRQPSAPVSKPTAPVTIPTAPAPKPTPVAKPAAPAPKPTAPVAKPAAPAPKHTAPVAKTTAPAPKPTAPAIKPTAPVAKPIAPAPKPTVLAVKPTAPVPKLTAPAPRLSVTKPSAPVPKPTAPAPKPTAPVPKPVAPVSKPTAPMAKPAAPALKPTASVPKPTAPTSRFTAPVPKPTAPKPSTPSPPTPLDCCDLPSGEREKQLLELYSTVSSKKDIETKDSPQNKAFNWILNKDEYCVCPFVKGCEPIQRYVMAVYYYSTKGENWANCGASSATCNPNGVINKGSSTSVCYSGAYQRWLSKNPSCKWCGNSCDDPLYPDCITQINLDNINQAGTLPQELKNITYLYYFSNEDGTISGVIPPQLGLLKNLSLFDINFQDVQGTLPDTFYKLNNLSTLDLNDNKLTGNISINICNLKNLFFFQAGNDEAGSNNFGGSTLPSCIGSMPTLAVFDVSNSNLKGNIPPFNNPNLSFLDVGDNDFTGNLTGPNWSNLKNLEILVLSGNPIEGTIPTTIGEIKTLQLADFTDMSLTGTMPAEMCANRNTNGGILEFLQSDCFCPPKVTCTCCTFCN